MNHVDHPRIVDLSHSIGEETITYKGLPAPVICDYLSREESRQHYAKDVTFQIGRIDMVANTGTYVDAPFHRYAEGADLAELPIESLAELDGITIDATQQGRAINAAAFRGQPLSNRAVLVHTGWSRHWSTDQYFEDHPYLTADAAQFLRDQGVRLVGIDSYNIDDTDDGARPVHSCLLKANIPICEHMTNLNLLPVSGYRFHAAPVKAEGMGTFPVRAYAVLKSSAEAD